MLHNCTYCNYNTTVKSNLRRHIRNIHGNNIASSTTMSVVEGRHPNAQ